MVDEVNITETAESKAAAEALDRARLARERREAEQRKRLDELRAHAAAAQAQREKREEERRRRQAEQRAKDDERRQLVEERKRAIWEASVSRREALLQREKDRTERLERARASRSSPRQAYAFGSSTPRLLEPMDNVGFFWAARSTNPIDQMSFFESLAASTSNVMFDSAPLTRRASALQLDGSEIENKDEPERQPQPVMWSSVARRRTDLVPTVPASRAPGRAYSMTRLDKIPSQRPLHSASPSMHHLNRTQTRSGETTPGSRPGSAMSNSTGVVRRTTVTRKPRPASIAGTGVNTPRGIGDIDGTPATTPSVSRDGSVLARHSETVISVLSTARESTPPTPRRPRPVSLHSSRGLSIATPSPGEGKPPLHRRTKPSKDHDRTPRGKVLSMSPGRILSPSPSATKEHSVDKEIHAKQKSKPVSKSQVSAVEVTQKLEALQIEDTVQPHSKQILGIKLNENKQVENNHEKASEETKLDEKLIELDKPVEKESDVVKTVERKETVVHKSVEKEEEKKPEKKEEKRDEKKESSQEKTEENEMTASMTARRITTEEEAKAALAERRRKAREELERQAELERQRLQREAEEEAKRQREEEERQRREEEEARELAQLQRRIEEEKLRKAIEVQQQLEREEAERKAREEVERQSRLKEEEERRRAAEEAEKQRREELEREERDRLARKQRVEAIMARTRHKKAEEEKKNQQQPQENGQQTQSVESSNPPASTAPSDNGNKVITGDLLGMNTSQPEVKKPSHEPAPATNDAPSEAPYTTPNNNLTADLLGLSEQNNSQDKIQELAPNTTKPSENSLAMAPALETNNGNLQMLPTSNIANLSANFIQTERMAEHNQKLDVPNLLDDDFTTHNGHNHPLTLQNAI